MFYFHAFSNGNIFTCIKTGKAEQKNIATSQTMTKAKSIALLALAFFATMGTSWLSKATAQTTTIFSEDFSDDSGSSTTTLTGDQWVATETTSSASGTMSITSNEFRFSANSTNTTYTCTWVSDPIAIGGFTGITLSSSSSGSGGTSSPSVSMSNGTYSNGSFLPDGGATTTVITFSFSIPKNKYRTLDNIMLQGTQSCTPTTWYADADGDGLGDPNSTTSACDLPTGYVADSSDLCDDTSACNYDANSNANASCQTNDACGVCGGSGVDVDSDGVCDDVDSCTDTSACNYTANPTAACSFAAVTWYEDADGDGLGDPAVSQTACSQPTGYVNNNNDNDPDLNPSDFTGTVLSPGDVYFSFAADAYSGIGDDYIGFTVLKDIESGTTLFLVSEWQWTGSYWGTLSATSSVIRWTAPAEGVVSGTEVILFDIDASPSSGIAKCDDENDPIVRASGNATLSGGQSCGTFEHLTSGRQEFNWETEFSWIFQPDIDWNTNLTYGTAALDGSLRHLTCLGYDLNFGGNTGAGTLIAGTDWSASMDAAYSYENANFNQSAAWAYQGGASVLPFAASASGLVTQVIGEGVSFSAANGATPTYSSIGNMYSELPYEPNGCISLSNSATWNGLANGPGIVNPSGNSALDIVVDSGVSLTVDAASEVACNDITVTSGVFMSCDGLGRTLAASGSITLGATGTFEGGQGTLKLSGLTAQTVDANNYADPSSDRFQLKDLVVENNKTATLKGHIKMKPGGAVGNLMMARHVSGDKLEIDSSVSSSLTFQSTSEGTAAIGVCEASNFDDGASQEFKFERFIPADTDNSWVNIAPYVTGTTVANWTDSIAGMLIFKYVETSYGSLAAGWQYVWNASEVLTPGTGYMALIPANTSGTFSVTGTFQMGDVDIALTFTDDLNQSNTTVDGWNLVANPYPAPVNLPQVLADNDLVESYYIFDNTGAGSYKETNDAGTGDAPTILDVGQSFWVKVSEATTITFSESDKVVDGSNTFLREFDPGFEGSLGLHVENEQGQWSNAFIGFHEEATPDFVNSEDAIHLDTELLNQLRMWTVAETGEHLAIQSLGSVATTPSVPLHMTTGAGGDITFELFEQDLMPENYCMVVEDTETGEKAQMGVETLTVNVPAETLYEGRFVLHFNAMPALELTSTTCDGLDIAELEGDWDAWDVAWESTDGELSGDGFPYDLPNGEYVFTYANGLLGCANAIPTSVQDACLGDFNANGTRDITDLMVLLAGMPGSGGTSVLGADVADCNCDGLVTIEDILTFLSVFSSTCEE